MDRKEGFELEADNYRELTSTTLPACEEVCARDQRCQAVEYYSSKGTCGLFDKVPPMKRAQGVAASVKRTSAR